MGQGCVSNCRGCDRKEGGTDRFTEINLKPVIYEDNEEPEDLYDDVQPSLKVSRKSKEKYEDRETPIEDMKPVSSFGDHDYLGAVRKDNELEGGEEIKNFQSASFRKSSEDILHDQTPLREGEKDLEKKSQKSEGGNFLGFGFGDQNDSEEEKQSESAHFNIAPSGSENMPENPEEASQNDIEKKESSSGMQPLPHFYVEPPSKTKNVITRDKKPPFQYRTGAVYEGEWLGQVRDGYGIQTWPDGAKYEGYWVNNKAAGFGKFKHADGDLYEGEWFDDKANGEGVYISASGSRYEGAWKEDLQGTL
jgi:MORN repeat